MKMKWMLTAMLVFSLIACATAPKQVRVWTKPGTTQQDFVMDDELCQAQALSAPGMPPEQVMMIYNSCLQGKGWLPEEK